MKTAMLDPLDEYGSEGELSPPPPTDPMLSLDEFSSELAAAESYRPAANPSPPAALPASALVSPTASAPLVSLEEILKRETGINWDEAVAVVEDVCAGLAPGETAVPGASDLFVGDGTVVRRDGARPQSDMTSAGLLLHSLLSIAGTAPVPLRLFVTQASAQGTYASIGAFAYALAYFGKPGRRELIHALYLRCATAAASRPAAVRAAEPKRETPPESAVQPARRRPSIPRWAVAVFATIVLSAAVGWVWSMSSSTVDDAILPSLVAQAREAVGRLGIGGPVQETPSAAPADAAPDVKPQATRDSRDGSPVDASRLVSRTFGLSDRTRPTRRRQPRRVNPVLVEPSPGAELSARRAEEARQEAVSVTIYSGQDADVEPPVLLHPQIPTNLMLAGESRLNIMELVVSETGSVERVRLVAGPSRLPDVMLLSGAKAWRFKPASRDGEAVRYRALVSWAGTP